MNTERGIETKATRLTVKVTTFVFGVNSFSACHELTTLRVSFVLINVHQLFGKL
eukprot:m.20822 g.20822  ORF g.20822 m.20822 type:complete len:54 (-) comp6962_c0_seq1:421-582(-)